jgi:hypothetical protein
MTTSNTKYVDAPTKTVIDSVNVYDTDFGRIAIHLSTIMNAAAAGSLVILGDMSLWQKAWLRPVRKKEMPIASWSSFYSIEAELTLESRQQNGSGKMSNLSTS